MDMSDAAAPVMVDLSDSAMWSKLLHKGTADQAPAAFTSTVQARRSSLGPAEVSDSIRSGHVEVAGSHGGAGAVAMSLPRSRAGSELSTVAPRTDRAPYEKDLFLVMSKPVLETLVALLGAVTEDQLIGR
jgi:hypothetical protein